ncbi:MAG: hypothetical protein JWP55_2026 [Mycobacterium sp.]|nr:hypothetical protein [Mycobacterium sp.]
MNAAKLQITGSLDPATAAVLCSIGQRCKPQVNHRLGHLVEGSADFHGLVERPFRRPHQCPAQGCGAVRTVVVGRSGAHHRPSRRAGGGRDRTPPVFIDGRNAGRQLDGSPHDGAMVVPQPSSLKHSHDHRLRRADKPVRETGWPPAAISSAIRSGPARPSSPSSTLRTRRRISSWAPMPCASSQSDAPQSTRTSRGGPNSPVPPTSRAAPNSAVRPTHQQSLGLR